MAHALRMVAVCVMLAALSVGTTCRSPNTHDDVFDSAGLLTASATDLKRTIVSAHLDVRIQPGQSILWCGTFQLAWNEARALVKEDLRFGEPSPLADALNRRESTSADLDAASYVAVAGFVRDNIHGRIERALAQKFGGAATPRLIPDRGLTPRPQDIVAYAYLFKSLDFPTPFERLEQPLMFGDAKLAAFGFDDHKLDHGLMYPNVLVLDYKKPDDFVIELKLKAAGDRLILANVPPGETLAATCRAVRARATTQPYAATAAAITAARGDVLRIPKLNLDITRQYSEVEGRRIVLRDPSLPQDLQLLSAKQSIRFQMNEKGVRLKSESHMAFGCAVEGHLPGRRMVFDKPFLILLQRTGAQAPYFAAWVDNPEILIGS